MRHGLHRAARRSVGICGAWGSCLQAQSPPAVQSKKAPPLLTEQKGRSLETSSRLRGTTRVLPRPADTGRKAALLPFDNGAEAPAPTTGPPRVRGRSREGAPRPSPVPAASLPGKGKEAAALLAAQKRTSARPPSGALSAGEAPLFWPAGRAYFLFHCVCAWRRFAGCRAVWQRQPGAVPS